MSITRTFSFITECGTCRGSATALLIQSHLVKESITIGTRREKSPAIAAAPGSHSSPHNGILLCLARVLMGTLPPGKIPNHMEASNNGHCSNKNQMFPGLPEEKQKKLRCSVAVVRHLRSCALLQLGVRRVHRETDSFTLPTLKNPFVWGRENF